MKNIDITRVWKDPVYRSKLEISELAEIPDNPAGLIEITDGDLGSVNGGIALPTFGGCTATIVLCPPPSLVRYCTTVSWVG